jgi:hypothetical protein
MVYICYWRSEQGSRDLVWKFQTGGPIHLSAAYKDGIIYFASNDNYAYALNVADGSLVWKSNKLPGYGFHSFWPVVYQDKVVLSASRGYRNGIGPGDGSAETSELEDVWPELTEGTLIGTEVTPQEWAHGYPLLEASRLTEYLEDNPNPDINKHKPWRRTIIVINTSDGSEYTYDSDGDGYSEYIHLTGAPIMESLSCRRSR